MLLEGTFWIFADNFHVPSDNTGIMLFNDQSPWLQDYIKISFYETPQSLMKNNDRGLVVSVK